MIMFEKFLPMQIGSSRKPSETTLLANPYVRI
jgi:hypothetical protein